MHVEHVALVDLQLKLYERPRDLSRFHAYLQELTGGGDGMVLPISAMNPMGKDHCLDFARQLVVLDADGVAAQAGTEAARRLDEVDDRLRTALVIADDAEGGWTERHSTEAQHRLDDRHATGKGWATTLLWTSEAPGAEEIHRSVVESVYRTAYVRRHGLPRTLAQAVLQEGLAQVFAGRVPEWDSPATAADAARIIGPLEGESRYPLLFAAMFGDTAASKLGYDSLGLPHRAGFHLGCQRVRENGMDPVRALQPPGTSGER